MEERPTWEKPMGVSFRRRPQRKQDVRLGSWVVRRGSGGCFCVGNQGLELCCRYVDEEITGAGRLGKGR